MTNYNCRFGSRYRKTGRSYFLPLFVGLAASSCIMEVADSPEGEPRDVASISAALGSTVTVATVAADAFHSIGSTLAVFENFTSQEFCPTDGQMFVRTVQLSNGNVVDNPVGCIALGGAASVSAAFIADVTNNDIRAASTNTKLADTNGDAQPQMLIDGTNVYWADTTGVRKVPRAGGATTTLVTTMNADLRWLDGSTIYYVDDGGAGIRRLRRVQTNGTGATTIAMSIGAAVAYEDLSVDSDFIYYAANGGATRYLRRLPKDAVYPDDPPPTTLASSTTDTFKFPKSNDANLYFVQVGSASSKIRRRTSGGVLSDQKTISNPIEGTRLGSVDLFWVEDTGSTFTVKRASLP